MRIDILAIGKIKEKYYRDAADEYIKRLSRYVKVNVVEIKDDRPDDLYKYIDDDAYLIPLCIEGEMLSSEGLADMITGLENKGTSHIQFVIGGSEGLDDAIKQKGAFKLSFSLMTFPHRLMRVILLEQVYRAYRIKNNEPYHK